PHGEGGQGHRARRVVRRGKGGGGWVLPDQREGLRRGGEGVRGLSAPGAGGTDRAARDRRDTGVGKRDTGTYLTPRRRGRRVSPRTATAAEGGFRAGSCTEASKGR